MGNTESSAKSSDKQNPKTVITVVGFPYSTWLNPSIPYVAKVQKDIGETNLFLPFYLSNAIKNKDTYQKINKLLSIDTVVDTSVDTAVDTSVDTTVRATALDFINKATNNLSRLSVSEQNNIMSIVATEINSEYSTKK